MHEATSARCLLTSILRDYMNYGRRSSAIMEMGRWPDRAQSARQEWQGCREREADSMQSEQAPQYFPPGPGPENKAWPENALAAVTHPDPYPYYASIVAGNPIY